MRFLVIDDEPDIASVIERVATSCGHQCTCVCSGAEALRAFEETTFDRVVSDLKMPGMTGDELYEVLASRKDPLIGKMAFITGNAMEQQNCEFLARTGVLVLEKPFSIDRLKEFIHEVEMMEESE